jgi:hypothetical protein
VRQLHAPAVSQVDFRTLHVDAVAAVEEGKQLWRDRKRRQCLRHYREV